MKHIEYWESKDGKRFETQYSCMEYEVKLVEKENGILYYNFNGNEVIDF